MVILTSALAVLASLVIPFGHAYDPNDHPLLAEETPKQLQGLGIDEHRGESIDLSIPFKDETNQTVTLQKYFAAGQPVILTIVYYDCPGLCNFHLNGLTAALKKVSWSAGTEYQVVAVSMDPRENAEIAAEKKQSYMTAYGRVGADLGWHFLTGAEPQIQKLAHEVGFKYRWDESQQQFSHASVAYVMTPEGKISRYLYGIEFEPQTVRLALTEASSGKIGNIVDQMILFCFHFDPSKNKYTLYAFNIMRAGAILIVVALAFILIPAWRRERRKLTPIKGEGT